MLLKHDIDCYMIQFSLINSYDTVLKQYITKYVHTPSKESLHPSVIVCCKFKFTTKIPNFFLYEQLSIMMRINLGKPF